MKMKMKKMMMVMVMVIHGDAGGSDGASMVEVMIMMY